MSTGCGALRVALGDEGDEDRVAVAEKTGVGATAVKGAGGGQRA
jgi:hypothetical protein